MGGCQVADGQYNVPLSQLTRDYFRDLNTRRPPEKPAILNSYKANGKSSVLPSNKSSTRNTNVENTISEQHKPYNNPYIAEAVLEILPIDKMTNVAINYEDLGVRPFDQESSTGRESYITYSTDDETIRHRFLRLSCSCLMRLFQGGEPKARKRINLDSPSNTSKNQVSATKKQRLEKYHELKPRMEEELKASQVLLDEDSQDIRQPNVDYSEEIRLP
ncbi:Uncharacterized protein APZ42_025345 [Daphnia magna]|uniref:Uncharacterized protein n=1 Tax=Daphnia magna TaxID=35525 RepID=A0A164T6S2_9CRUS|nr:Uncharacterized protein APZ42_025345 [Daphnia magna]